MRLPAVWLAAVAAACSSAGPPGDEADSGAGPVAEPGPPAPDDYQRVSVVDLGEGSHAVFGLRIPRGMRPVPGPHKVYRFEGTLDPVAARRQVMRQVETALLQEEPAGFLIRRARVLQPASETDPGVRLAIRIFRGRTGGATIDVWAERDLDRERAARGAGAGGAGGPAGDGTVRIEPGSPEARRRAEERREAFELLEKIGKGEPLSPEEAASPLLR